MSLSLNVVEVGQAGLEPATSASSVPRFLPTKLLTRAAFG